MCDDVDSDSIVGAKLKQKEGGDTKRVWSNLCNEREDMKRENRNLETNIRGNAVLTKVRVSYDCCETEKGGPIQRTIAK